MDKFAKSLIQEQQILQRSNKLKTIIEQLWLWLILVQNRIH